MEPLTFLIFVAIVIFPLWKIFGKAGFNPALSLLIILPLIGTLIVVLILAFARWPALERLARGTSAQDRR